MRTQNAEKEGNRSKLAALAEGSRKLFSPSPRLARPRQVLVAAQQSQRGASICVRVWRWHPHVVNHVSGSPATPPSTWRWRRGLAPDSPGISVDARGRSTTPPHTRDGPRTRWEANVAALKSRRPSMISPALVRPPEVDAHACSAALPISLASCPHRGENRRPPSEGHKTVFACVRAAVRRRRWTLIDLRQATRALESRATKSSPVARCRSAAQFCLDTRLRDRREPKSHLKWRLRKIPCRLAAARAPAISYAPSGQRGSACIDCSGLIIVARPFHERSPCVPPIYPHRHPFRGGRRCWVRSFALATAGARLPAQEEPTRAVRATPSPRGPSSRGRRQGACPTVCLG